MRTAYDFSPLYRSIIGVDRLADLIDNAMRSDGDRSYPPYDVEKTGEDGYRITLAAAGFAADELEITAQPNLLVVSGRKIHDEKDGERAYLHRGIAGRDFERRFELADHVVVTSAAYDNGVLAIDLVREVPEALKPRRIEIAASGEPPAMRRIDNPQPERQAA
ncbi:Hsp20 family protein [Brevundimonas sp.]|uniref:Hsp20 family protein n=1 Tax=Brevundimonas sp. TaxID=1871086 RepID=UPI002737D7B9|nr:Hsp20 family protein [Brevundimonas sp.]MDP3801410.1 Hsp20 family protein [Brevundimonas sp.]